jgi:predicted ferric reductase
MTNLHDDIQQIDMLQIDMLTEQVETYTFIYMGVIFGIIGFYSIYHYVSKYCKSKQDIYPKMHKPIQSKFTKVHKFLFKRVYEYPVYFYLVCSIFVIMNCLFMFFSAGRKELFLKSTGTFLAADILISVISAAKHSPLIIILYHYYDSFLGFHKFLGFWIIIISILHTVFYIINYSRPILQNSPFEANNLIYPLPRLFGTLALIAVLLMGLFSINCMRRRNYRIFAMGHLLYPLFIVFTALHRPYFIPYLIVIFSIVLIDYFIRMYYLSHKYVAGIKVYGEEYISLFFERNNMFKSRVGQHVFICIPSISMCETHPFSIISHSNSSTIELGIKSLGSYTQKIIEYGKHSQICDIRISGLFGSFGFNYLRYEELVFVCGGIGATPFIGVLKDLYYNPSDNYCIEHITFMWFCRDEVVYGVYEDFIEICIRKNLEFNKVFPYFMPIISIKSRPINKGIFQSVDLDILFEEILCLDNSEIPDIDEKRRIGVLCCGAESLSDDVWDHCTQFTNENTRVDFHNHSFIF